MDVGATNNFGAGLILALIFVRGLHGGRFVFAPGNARSMGLSIRDLIFGEKAGRILKDFLGRQKWPLKTQREKEDGEASTPKDVDHEPGAA